MSNKPETKPEGNDREQNTEGRRICDEQCPNCWKTKGGHCKEWGDVYGKHSGNHICSTCYHQW